MGQREQTEERVWASPTRPMTWYGPDRRLEDGARLIINANGLWILLKPMLLTSKTEGIWSGVGYVSVRSGPGLVLGLISLAQGWSSVCSV